MDEKQKQYVKRKADKAYKILKNADVGRQISFGIELYSQSNPLDLEAVRIAKERIDEERKSSLLKEKSTIADRLKGNLDAFAN